MADFDDEIVGTEGTASNFEDEIVEVQQPGMVSAFKRGNLQANMGREAYNAYNLSQEIDRYSQIERGSTNPAEQEMARMKRQQLEKGVGNNLDAIRSQSADASLLPKSPAYEEFTKAEGFKAAGSAFLKAPGTVTREVVAESIGGQAKALPLIAGAGLVGGVPGLVAATGASSMALESNAGMLELLTELNVDVNDPVAVSRAMASPEFRAAKADKLKKAATIATVDSVTAGIAGVKLRPSVGGNVGAQIGVQAAGGGGGEALGSMFADEEIEASAVMAEMIGGIPGAVVDVGVLSINKQMNLPTLAHVADQDEKEAATGFNDVQKSFDDEVKHENKKPKLSRNQSQVVVTAIKYGVDPQTALAIAGVETGGKYNFDAKNPESSAQGMFQITDDTWEGLGGGDRNDPELQLERGMQLLQQNTLAMEQALGRKPTTSEVYLAHMFGAKGAKSLLGADPNMSMLDAVRKYDPKNASAIVVNNRMSGMTVKEARAKWEQRIAKEILATGGNPEMNLMARAGKDVDAAPEENFMEELEGLDALLEEAENRPLTPEDIDAALKETELTPADPIARVEAELLADEDTVPDAVVVAEESDRAVVTLDQARFASTHVTERGKFNVTTAMNELENTVTRAVEEGREVKLWADGSWKDVVGYDRGIIDSNGKVWSPSTLLHPKNADNKLEVRGMNMTPQAQRADTGVSMDEAATRERYDNPNDAFAKAPSAAPIVAANAPGIVGTRLGDHQIQPGEVVAAGVDSAHTPQGYMEAVRETVQEAISLFAPTARVALTFATEDRGSISSHQRLTKALGTRNKIAAGKGLYRLNMRNATNLGITDSGTRNSTTRMKILSATWHEVGHIVADEQMTKGMSPAMKERFRNLPRDEYFTEEELANLPPEQSAVLREYNGLKWQVLNNPQFTAEQFATQWLSPWKLAHGVGTNAKSPGLLSFVRMYMGQVEAGMLQAPAKEFASILNERTDILSPHEYMAEQMSRYAYNRGLFDTSSLVTKFFREALDAMQRFFRQLKRGGDVKPGVAFAEWVDSLTNVAKDLGTNKALPMEPAAKPEPKPRVKPRKKAEVSVTEREPLLPQRATAPERIATVAVKEYSNDQIKNLELLAGRLRYMQTTNPTRYQHYMDLVRANRLEDFYQEGMQQLPDEIADQIRHDTDVPGTENWQEIELNLPKVVQDKQFLRGFKIGAWSLRRGANYATTLSQRAYANPEVAGLQSIDLLKSNYKAFKSKLEFAGLEVADRWSKLGKEQHGLLEQAMREEHATGENFAELTTVNGVKRFVANERLQDYARSKGLSEDSVGVWLGAKNAHLRHMNALENVLKKKMADRYKGKPKTLQVKAAELHQMFEAVRNSPFLPQTRFGEFAVHVKEKTPDGEKIVHVEFFETEGQRDEGLRQLQKAAGAARKVQAARYAPTSAILRTLPPQILTTYAEEFSLTDMERKELKQIADAITRNPALRKYSSQLARVTGANKDLHKNFADFMWHSSNNIAKLHYKEHFEKGLVRIQMDMHEASDEGDLPRYDKLESLLQFAKGYVDHIMSPQDEFQKLRALVVVKMLWGNVKTAAANISSLINLWGLAATQQGVVGGSANVAGNTLKVMNERINSVYNRVMRQKVEGAQVYAPDTLWALDQAKTDGLMDESYAAQLGKFAQSGTLSRLNFERGDSIYKKLIWYGMLPQHVTEVFVREVTLVNQFENYMRQGMKKQEAYLKARSDTYRLQGDNSLLNRPAFMRGKMAPFLIFYGFVQNQLYLLSGAQERARNLHEGRDAIKALNLPEAETKKQLAEARKKFYRIRAGGETVKMWLAWSMLGGMMGVPGAENLDDILELVSKKFFGTRFSLKEHAFALAKDITDNARQYGLDVNPRSLVHGMGADFDFLGLGPKVDFSSSLGMGNLLPGGNALGEVGGDKARFLLGAMGPLGQVVDQFMNVFSDDPSMMKKSAFFMPSVVHGAVKSVYEWENGVRAPSAGKITLDRETGELRDLTTGEMLIRFMGFQPEIITANKEIHWMQKDAQDYWTTRRNMLVGQLFEAQLMGDREAIADANESLDAFNDRAPPQLRITGKELNRALKRKDKLKRKDEGGISRQKRFQDMDDEIAGNVRGQ